MQIYVVTDQSGQVLDIGTQSIGMASYPVDTKETDIHLDQLAGYYVLNGELFYDANRYKEAQEKEQAAKALEQAKDAFDEIQVQMVLAQATGAQAYRMKALYPEWSPNGVTYKAGTRLRYKDGFYKTLKDTTTQATWPPDTATSEFVAIPDPDEEWPEYKQPTDSADAYSKGAKVTFKGEHYISEIDANTHSPAEYPAGWRKV